MALVLQSGVSSYPGDPLTLLHSWLLPGPKEAPYTTADCAVDTAGVQVRLCLKQVNVQMLLRDSEITEKFFLKLLRRCFLGYSGRDYIR